MDHVAIMKKSWGLTQKILSGEKTLESRWYMVRCAPWDRVHPNDRIFFKDAGGPVSIRAKVSKVEQFADLTPGLVALHLRQRAAADGILVQDIPRFLALFRRKRYCMFIHLRNVHPVEPFEIDKTGFGSQAAWLCVGDIARIRK